MPAWSRQATWLKGTGAVAVPAIVLLSAMWAVKKWMLSVFSLPEKAYEKPVVVLQLVENIGFGSIVLILAVTGIFIYKGKFFSLLSPWKVFENHRNIQWLAVLPAALLGWSYATYGYNFYFHQSHEIDRWLIVLGVFAVYWRPVFVFPLVAMIIAIMGQFLHPLGAGYSRQIDLLLLDALILTGCAFLLRLFTEKINARLLVFLVCCLLAAHYWVPAWGKIKLNWLTHGHLNFFMAGAYTNGWLSTVSTAQLSQWVAFMERFDWPMRIGTLVLEAGALLFFWRRRLAIALVVGWALFHISAFAMSGFLFWKWIVFELAIAALFFKRGDACAERLFQREYLVVSLLIIGFGKVWFTPPGLAWYDTNLSYGYRLEAQTNAHERLLLSPAFFSGYADIMTFANFGFLAENDPLVNPYGVSRNRRLAEELLTISSDSEKIFAMEQAHVSPEAVLEKRRKFADFIRNYLNHFNDRRQPAPKLCDWQSPANFWTFESNPSALFTSRVDTVRIYQYVAVFDQLEYRPIRKQLCCVISLNQETQ